VQVAYPERRGPAFDGFAALDGFRTEPPDLAILDIKMPRMGGMESFNKGE